MHVGGWADKLGNRYEGRWTAEQLLRLLDGKLQAVRLESVNEEHVDLYLMDNAGNPEFHQCKRKIDRNGWTLTDLKSRGVADAIRAQLIANPKGRFVFVSNQPATDLLRLIKTAHIHREQADLFAAIQGTNDEKAWNRWCKAVGYENDPVVAFDLLNRTDVEMRGDEHRDIQHLHETANYVVVGDPRDVVLRLAAYAEQKMGQWIHVDTMRNFVRNETTFKLRELAHSDAIQPAIEKRQAEYRNSVFPYLVREKLISRPEARRLFDAINGGQKRIHIIHGAAGQGKSCVLLELMKMLKQEAIPFLPLRLDTRVPRDNSRAFGVQLELPESPVRCLRVVSGTRTSVLILDQLDALRWSPQHDPSSCDRRQLPFRISDN